MVSEVKLTSRTRYSSEAKIGIILEWLRGEYSIAKLWRREGITPGLVEGVPGGRQEAVIG